MGATLNHEGIHYERRAQFNITHRPHETHPDHFTIDPQSVAVEVTWEDEGSAWEISWVTVTGPRILKSGQPGQRWEKHYYTPRGIRTAPDWIQSLARGYLVQCELSRQDRTLTPADVKTNPEYWISGPGRAIAMATHCPEGYTLVDSCPACDHIVPECTEHASFPAGVRACNYPLDTLGRCANADNHGEFTN